MACSPEAAGLNAVTARQIIAEGRASIAAHTRCVARYIAAAAFSDEFRHFTVCSVEYQERHYACSQPEVDADGAPIDYCTVPDYDGAVGACRTALVPAAGCEDLDADDFAEDFALLQMVAFDIGPVACGAPLPENFPF